MAATSPIINRATDRDNSGKQYSELSTESYSMTVEIIARYSSALRALVNVSGFASKL